MDFFPWPMVGNLIQLVRYGLFFFIGWLWRARVAHIKRMCYN